MQSVVTFSNERQMWVVVPAYSQVGVFVKSLHLLAAAWVLTVMYLWLALAPIQRVGENMLAHAIVPALALVTMGLTVERWTKSMGIHVSPHGHEWGRAFTWTISPIVFLLIGLVLTIG